MRNNITFYGIGGCITWLATFAAMYGMWIILSALLAWPVSLLWNAVIPSLLGLPRITFMQAFALKLLVGFLFGHNLTLGDNKGSNN